MIDFPCAVHLDDYNDIKIAVNAENLIELRGLGYITSSEWYAKNLGIIDANEAEDSPRRGRKPKEKLVQPD